MAKDKEGQRENKEGVCEELLLIKYPLPEWKINLHTDNRLTSITELYFFQ